MITISRADPVRMVEIWKKTPVRDGLECYFRLLQEEAMENFMHHQMLFVQGGMKKAPKPPAILKMRTRRKRKRGAFKEPEKPAFLVALEEREE